MKNAWPVKAQALGGRHYKLNPEGVPYVDQNFDAIPWNTPSPTAARCIMDGRCMNGCNDIYSSYVHGSKGLAIASKASDCGAPSSIFKGQNAAALQHALDLQDRAGPASIPIRTSGTT